ncbi:MAG TPA: hypothetical protein VK335_11885 [Bryobacteraceae bacterium]|nr:hypothetical protein [Bryobacteraceae bacterium]
MDKFGAQVFGECAQILQRPAIVAFGTVAKVRICCMKCLDPLRDRLPVPFTSAALHTFRAARLGARNQV